MDWRKLLGLAEAPEQTGAALGKLVEEIEKEYDAKPPTVAVIGLSGVGKSSAINAMFGTALKTSATVRGTTQFETVRARLTIQRGEGAGGVGYLRVYDAPGLGEDRRMDPSYLRMYEEYLPRCDIALWIVAARNRALALDQAYLERLAPLLSDKVVFGLSQVDLVDPNDWDRSRNMPSPAQNAHIDEIVEDRSHRLGEAFGRKVECLAFSAAHYYRLMELYQHIVSGAPKDRRWMFELVRSFSAADWLAGVEGLSVEEKAKMSENVRTREFQVAHGAGPVR